MKRSVWFALVGVFVLATTLLLVEDPPPVDAPLDAAARARAAAETAPPIAPLPALPRVPDGFELESPDPISSTERTTADGSLCQLDVVLVDGENGDPWQGEAFVVARHVATGVIVRAAQRKQWSMALNELGSWELHASAWRTITSPSRTSPMVNYVAIGSIEVAPGQAQTTIELQVIVMPEVLVRVQAGDGLPLLGHPELGDHAAAANSLVASLETETKGDAQTASQRDRSFRSTQSARRELPADAIGLLQIQLDGPQSVVLWLGKHRLDTVPVEEGAEEVLFIIPPATLLGALGGFRLQVLDARTQQPLQNVAYTLGKQRATALPEVPGGYQVTGLQPQREFLLLSKRDYMKELTVVEIEAGKVQELGTIELKPIVPLEIQVRDRSGQPYAAKFALSSRLPDGQPQYTAHSTEGLVISNADGLITLKRVGAGTYYLHQTEAVASKNSDTLLRARLTELNVPDLPSAHFAVTLEPTAPVELNYKSELVTTGRITFSQDNFPILTTPVTEGRPRTAHLLPGTYTWSFSGSFFSPQKPGPTTYATASGTLSVPMSGTRLSILPAESPDH